MVLLGLLVVVGVIGVAWYAVWTNQGAFEAAAGTVDIFGYSAQLTNGQVFLVGAVAGAVLLSGLFLMMRGMGRNARRGAAARRELRELRQAQQPVKEQELAKT